MVSQIPSTHSTRSVITCSTCDFVKHKTGPENSLESNVTIHADLEFVVARVSEGLDLVQGVAYDSKSTDNKVQADAGSFSVFCKEITVVAELSLYELLGQKNSVNLDFDNVQYGLQFDEQGRYHSPDGIVPAYSEIHPKKDNENDTICWMTHGQPVHPLGEVLPCEYKPHKGVFTWYMTQEPLCMAFGWSPYSTTVADEYQYCGFIQMNLTREIHAIGVIRDFTHLLERAQIHDKHAIGTDVWKTLIQQIRSRRNKKQKSVQSDTKTAADTNANANNRDDDTTGAKAKDKCNTTHGKKTHADANADADDNDNSGSHDKTDSNTDANEHANSDDEETNNVNCNDDENSSEPPTLTRSEYRGAEKFFNFIQRVANAHNGELIGVKSMVAVHACFRDLKRVVKNGSKSTAVSASFLNLPTASFKLMCC